MPKKTCNVFIKKAREAIDVRVRRVIVAVEVHRRAITPIVPVAADKDHAHCTPNPYKLFILKTVLLKNIIGGRCPQTPAKTG